MSALEILEPSELILIDKTYKDRLNLRKRLLLQHRDIVVAVNSDGNKTTDTLIRAAVSELYTFVLGEYLPTRYPNMFRVENGAFENLVTGETWPTPLKAETPTIQALEILMQTIDEDFLILLPELSPSSADQPKYILQAYTTCFPSGFNPREKLGRKLADIHGPVPGYAEKLERSMDRFFARVEVGKYVKRVNWSITTGAELFAAFGEVHGSLEEESPSSEQGSRAMKLEELDLDKVCYYCLIAAWKDADIYRRFCAVSVRLCIVFPILRLWSLLFILIHIPYSGLRMRGLVRSWWLRLMGLRKGMYLL